ncbi:type II CAAX prenyl endopeptidase Rce1 family protein [Microseira sp. BLCC-F43]|jgi:predicted Abi (CAAX) family protease|uniref:CPBP family glutamic-type intramembrane protease n=1 Tax=Microseira sp. BLCC-F43 TaxID=3153602 RepID=UPI0035BA424A
MTGVQTLVYRCLTAISTLPSAQACLSGGLPLLLLTLISLPVGFYFNFLQLDILKAAKKTVASVVAGSLLTALGEELFFRVLFLPHPSESATLAVGWFWGGVSLGIFIIYHPLNALSFYPPGRHLFFNPIFLLLAGFLGVACTLAYLQSGSFWLPVAIHWLTLLVWLLLLGGYGKLNSEYIKD